MNRSHHLSRLAALLAAGALTSVCGGSTTAPSPPPATPGPPVITCPSLDPLTSITASPMPVVFTEPTVAGGKDPIAKSCRPASGSVFALGSTPVTCSATDALQRSSSCTFTVTVKAPPRVLFTKFVAFGDSITAGENGQESLTSVVGQQLFFDRSVILFGFEYPTVLQSDLRARYALQADGIAVANKGVPGQQAADPLTATYFRQALTGNQVVLLMMGSNDLYFAYSDTDPGVRIAAAISALQSMVRTARASGIRPYLATVPPMDPRGSVPARRGFAASLVPGFDDRIRALASAEGVPLVDVYKAFNGDLTLISPDGLHPNQFGYDRIATTFFDAIKSTIEAPTTTSFAIGNSQFRTQN